jgi:hypothetical protein
MRLDHLGDALDHWKGSVIRLVKSERLKVLPMLTDQDRWSPEDFKAYARLLGRRPQDFLRKDALFAKSSRAAYFRLPPRRDVFLDPDTGIASELKANEKRVKPSEIATLLKGSPSRMLLIYQHASRKKDGIRDKLGLLRSTEGLKRCHLFAYDSGAASMVFISKNKKRIQKALARLQCWLGPVARTRIIK